MEKTLKPVDLESRNHLTEVDAPIRAQILSELPQKEKSEAIGNLVESAMTMGLLDAFQIRQWLGIKGLNIHTVQTLRDKIKTRWLNETENVFEYAKAQRATQIKKAWDEVRNCERMFIESIAMKDKIAVKKLQLDWMLYISKLSFVDKMVEASQPDMQIIVNGSMNMEDSNGN